MEQEKVANLLPRPTEYDQLWDELGTNFDDLIHNNPGALLDGIAVARRQDRHRYGRHDACSPWNLSRPTRRYVLGHHRLTTAEATSAMGARGQRPNELFGVTRTPGGATCNRDCQPR